LVICVAVDVVAAPERVRMIGRFHTADSFRSSFPLSLLDSTCSVRRFDLAEMALAVRLMSAVIKRRQRLLSDKTSSHLSEFLHTQSELFVTFINFCCRLFALRFATLPSAHRSRPAPRSGRITY
jgi:hypothetical protein